MEFVYIAYLRSLRPMSFYEKCDCYHILSENFAWKKLRNDNEKKTLKKQ